MINGDLKKMDEGKMDATNRDRLYRGRILCIISVVILTVITLISLLDGLI